MEEYQHNSTYTQPQQTAPYAVASMVLGIASLVMSGIGITLVLGIIGLVLSNKGLDEYRAHPELYTGEGMLQSLGIAGCHPPAGLCLRRLRSGAGKPLRRYAQRSGYGVIGSRARLRILFREEWGFEPPYTHKKRLKIEK